MVLQKSIMAILSWMLLAFQGCAGLQGLSSTPPMRIPLFSSPTLGPTSIGFLHTFPRSISVRPTDQMCQVLKPWHQGCGIPLKRVMCVCARTERGQEAHGKREHMETLASLPLFERNPPPPHRHYLGQKSRIFHLHSLPIWALLGEATWGKFADTSPIPIQINTQIPIH